MTDHLKLFDGKRVLIVEDEYFVAQKTRSALERLGAQVIGPVSTVAEGISLVEDGGVDAAILDVNLDGETVFPLPDLLDRLAIPFVFATGYDPSIIPDRYTGYVLCEKPTRLDVIAMALFAPVPINH